MITEDLTAQEFGVVRTATKTHGDSQTDIDVRVGRWTNYGKDRLYINDLFSSTTDVYVDLETDDVVVDGTATRTTGLEVDGGVLVITVERPSNSYEIRVEITTIENEDEDESDESEADDEKEVAADGGVDVSGYEIDPSEIEYDRTCSTHDSTNNRTDHLCRIKDSDIWVAYRTWQTGPSEYQSSIKGIGRLSLSGVDLDTDLIAETIRDRANTDIEEGLDEHTETDEILKTLAENADRVAEALEDAWQSASSEVLSDSIYDEIAGISGSTAWVSHVQDAYRYEVDDALSHAGIEKDEHGRAVEHAQRGLSEAVAKRRNNWLSPNLEYEAALEFEVETWELRALELECNSVLDGMPQTARVWALKEDGYRQMDIAERMDINQSTVSRHISRAKDRIQRATWTAEKTLDVAERGGSR